jgi:hypothetical protein
MRRIPLFVSIGVAAILSVALFHYSTGNAQEKQGMLLSHDVFFTLKDNSPAAKKKLVDACKKYLSGHEGEVFFSAGTLVESLKREVNDVGFDVGLHIVFKDMAAHDKYQDHPRHLEFIKENKDNWKKVRVFDSYVDR